MSQYPEAVQALHDAIDRLPGVTEIDLGIRQLDGVSEQALSLPGEFGDLPHLAIRRTKGGLADEMLVTAEVRLEQSFAGWIALEFLAWWVRDLSRSGHGVQMRPLALPPIAYGTQLGRTLKFAVEFFFINPEPNNDPVLARLADYANSLNSNIDDYAQAIDRPTRAQHDGIESLETSAANDDALAQLHLAQHYQAGGDVAQDLAAAFHWYERAASHGHPQAILQLGRCYADGAGVSRDPVQAFELFRQAANGGITLAFQLIGQCYERGEGVEVNLPEALKWYRQALDLGLEDMQSAIDRVESASRAP